MGQPSSQGAATWHLWGKTSRSKDPATGHVLVHPLLCHMLDVAAVAMALWEEVVSASARRELAHDWRLGEVAAGRWLAFWAGLHDLGKASPAFQSLHQSAYEVLQTEGALPCRPHPPTAPHGTITTATLPAVLRPFGVNARLASRVGTVIGGHHGVFPSTREVQDVSRHAIGPGPWHEVRQAYARQLAEVLGVPSTTGTEARPGQLSNSAAMMLAGLISVADWIGSIESYFPYILPHAGAAMMQTAASYAECSAGQAQKALAALRWTGWKPRSGPRTFKGLFPGIEIPNTLQQCVVELATPLCKQQGLVIVEAPMGEGKTEAAMYLADQWGTHLGQRGCYFALPTQATSNQMFTRVRAFLAQ